MTPGTLFAQRFLIERLAGSGAMGRVYRALDQHTGQVVALKVLAGGQVEDARFRREAALLADLSHPRIVRWAAHGETPTGETYLAMEWLDGEDLAARLARSSAIGVAGSVRVARQAAEALGAAHARGVVHRDVKPGNLFLVGGSTDDLKVIDFGIALVAAEVRRLTRTGVVLGTLGYMAPEQARGERDLDPRVDVFALGCVLFECLTGRAPFASENGISALARILLEEAPRVSDLVPGIPPALDDLVGRMLAKRSEERPRDGREVAEALASLDGAAVGEDRAARPATLTHVEQRVLCVLFVQPRPEDGAASASSLTVSLVDARSRAAEATAIVEKFGARLHALADETLVITLSGRGAATDQAARAARCALALRAAQPAARMVLCTGRCDVGARLPAGEVIDRAARLLRDVAEDDARSVAAVVHLDDVTGAMLDRHFDVRPGAHGPELYGEHVAFDTARTLLGQRAPFVGRERELAALEASVTEARADEVASVVLVTAPPGAGKSRLSRELVHRLRAAGEPIEVWLGRADPMRSGAPFGMIADALRSAAGAEPGEPIDVTRRKLEARVARHLAPGDARRVAEFLGEIAGAPFPASVELAAARSDATLMIDQVTLAFRDLLAGELAKAPVLIVLEDLHWGDLPSTKLVDTALRSFAHRPLVVLALARPEVTNVFPRLWAERPLEQIHLGELTRRSSERLVREVLGANVSEARVERIVAWAAGNALYLEELIRAEARGEGDELPDTVLAMVQARLSTLADEVRRALRAASIFGLEFRLPGVAALLGARAEVAAAHLGELCEREIIERRSVGRSDASFRFRHALFREAAYASLTPEDRARGHRLAAAWLEEAGERDGIVLAEHAERGERPAEAARWYRRAAEQALEASDIGAALARAERGVACGATGDEMGALRRVQASAHAYRGESTAGEVRALEAIELLPEGSASWLYAVGTLVGIRCRQGRFADVIAWSTRLRALDPEARDATEALTLALLGAAGGLCVAGRATVADPLIAHIEEHLLPRAAGAPHVVPRLAMMRAMRFMYDGDLGNTLEAFETAAQSYAAIGDLRGSLIQRYNVALVLLELGQDEEAERQLDAIARAEGTHLDVTAAFGRHALGRILRLRGDVAGARALAEQTLAEAVARSNPRHEGAARQYLAEALAAAGDLEGALRELRSALAQLEPFRAVYLEALAVHAELLLAAGRVAEALAAAREGMALLTAEGGGMAEGESRLRLAFVEALAAAGETEAARAALQSAVARLFARANRLSDPALRQGFLERVRENARLVTIAREWEIALPT